MTEAAIVRGAPSRPLDVHRWSDYPELSSCLAQLVSEIEAQENRRRARSANAARKLRDAVRAIVLDLYVAHTSSPEYEIGVSLAKDSFSNKSRYHALFFTYDGFTSAYRGLRDLGYLAVVREGFNDPGTGVGRNTRIRATDELIRRLTTVAKLTTASISHGRQDYAAETIILRDGEKKRRDYQDNSVVATMRADVARINEGLDRHWLDLYLTDDQLRDMNVTMRRKWDHANDPDSRDHEAGAVDFSAKCLRRIFNNDSWDQGGRFYGGWWQTVPRDYRRFITINGKHTIELDYSGMHPTLLYARAGVEPIGDAYDVGMPSVPREIIKAVFNKLLNAKSRTMPTSAFDERAYGLTWRDLEEAVKARHQPIREFFNTGYGVRLQTIDANIANQVMLRFLDRGYPCLPVHDSFIVHHAMANELREVMASEFMNEVGRAVGMKMKTDFISMYIPPNGDVVFDDTAFLQQLDGTGEYTLYHTRENAWNNRRHSLEVPFGPSKTLLAGRKRKIRRIRDLS